MSAHEIAAWLLVALNLIASVRALVDDLSTRRQKLLQVVFVWLIPVAGALFTLSILRYTSAKQAPLRRFLPAWFAAPAFGAGGDVRSSAGSSDWSGDDGGAGGGDSGGGGGGK